MPVPHEELSRSGPRVASNVRRLVRRRGVVRVSRPCAEDESSELTVEQTPSERIRLGVMTLDPGPYEDGEAPTLLIRREAVSFAAIPVEHDLSELIEVSPGVAAVAPAARGATSAHRSVGRIVVPSFSGLRWARLGARSDRPVPRAAFSSPFGRRSSTWKRLAVVAIVLCLACALAVLVRPRGGSHSVVTTGQERVVPPPRSSTATVIAPSAATSIASTTSSAAPVTPADTELTSKSAPTPRRRTATPAQAVSSHAQKKRPLLDIF